MKSRIKRLLEEAGEVLRISFIILLVALLITLLYYGAFIPTTGVASIRMHRLAMAVIIIGVVSALLPQKANGTELQVTARIPVTLWALYALLGLGICLAVLYATMGIRMSYAIAGISGFLVVIFTINYRRNM